MKINQQGLPQIAQQGNPQIGQTGPSEINTTQQAGATNQSGPAINAHQFEQAGSLASQLLPNPSMNQSAPSTGQSLLSLQIGQTGQTDQAGQIQGPDLNPGLTRVENAADAFMAEVEKIQGRITEELRTEDAITSVSVGKGEHDYQLNVVIGPNQTFTPPQVKAASERLLAELGYEGVDVNVIAPEVNPFPGFPSGGLGAGNVPADLKDGITNAVDNFFNGNQTEPLAEKPNVEGLEQFLLRDMMPVDGPKDEVYVNRNDNTFYLSSTIVSMMGPEHSGTSWYGPFNIQ